MLTKEHPELFPPEIAFGYKMKEIRVSKKLKLKVRRIVIAGVCYTIMPSFAMPYMTGFVKKEAECINPAYQPDTVNTDGWQSTQNAWKTLFPKITVLFCK